MNLHSKKASLIWTILMILSGLFPVPLALGLYLNPAVLPHLPILCAMVGLAAFLADSPSKQRRILCGSLCAILLCLYGALIFSHPLPLLLIPVLYLAQLLFLLRPHPGTVFFQLPFFLSCLAIYGAFQFGMMTLTNIQWAAAFPFFLVSFLLFLFSGLVLNNQDLLQVEIRFGRKVPLSVLNVSRLSIFLLLFAALIITCIPQISQFLRFLYQTLRDLLLSLAKLLSSLFRDEIAPESAPLPGSSFFPAAEAAAEAPSNPILEMILNILTWAFLLSLVLYLLFRIAKLLLWFLRRLVRRFQQYISAFDTAYEDTYEDLPQSDATRQGLFFRNRKPAVSFGDSPRGKIRSVYLKQLLRHPEWSPSETAKDHLCQPAAELYEKARYSTHDMTDEEAARFSSLAGHEFAKKT